MTNNKFKYQVTHYSPGGETVQTVEAVDAVEAIRSIDLWKQARHFSNNRGGDYSAQAHTQDATGHNGAYAERV